MELQNVNLEDDNASEADEGFAIAIQEVQMVDETKGNELPAPAQDANFFGEGEVSPSRRRATGDESDDLVIYRGRRRTNSLRVGHSREDYTKEVRVNL